MDISPRHYLLLCLSLTAAVLGTIGAINYAVDPYALYHHGWPPHRAGVDHFLYAHKARAVEAAKPDVLILGSSRALYGIDPNRPGLPAGTYNLALEGARLYVNWRYLQHAAAFHVPKMVLLGVDRHAFDWADPAQFGFSEERLAVDAACHANPLRSFADIGSTLFSTTALYYSVKSITGSARSDFPFDQGYQANAMADLNHLNLPRNVLAANREFLNPDLYDTPAPNGGDPEMDAFAKIVAFCAERHIHLIVFVQPLHAVMTDLLTADEDHYAAWMKALVATMESVPAGQNELWDFTGYNNLTTENFPAATDAASGMRYFWECSHYRSNVGGLMLARMLNAATPGPFGQRVNSANLAADLDRIRAEKEAWHQHGQAVWVDPPPAGADSAPK